MEELGCGLYTGDRFHVTFRAPGGGVAGFAADSGMAYARFARVCKAAGAQMDAEPGVYRIISEDGALVRGVVVVIWVAPTTSSQNLPSNKTKHI